MVSNVTFKSRKTNHEHGIEIHTDMEHAKRLDAKNGNTFWIEAINKTPVKIVKKLALTVQHFFTRYGGWQAVDKKQLAPLHIAAERGQLDIQM